MIAVRDENGWIWIDLKVQLVRIFFMDQMKGTEEREKFDLSNWRMGLRQGTGDGANLRESIQRIESR